jgi:hypothetical protein
MVSSRKAFSSALALGIAVALLALVVAGCSSIAGAVSAAIGKSSAPSADSPKSTNDSASEKSGSRASKTMAYQYEFNAFYGGMWNMGWLGYKESTYKIGQGTIWKFTGSGKGSDDAVTFERALLKVNADSAQWWRFKLDTSERSTLYEFLVSADAKVQKVRFKDPDTGTIEEFVPSSTGPSGGSTATPKSQADMAKYRVDRKMVKVQAGSFMADHYLYPDEQGNGSTESWVAQSVPGSILKSVYTRSKDKQTSTVELIQIETGITTVLGSY